MEPRFRVTRTVDVYENDASTPEEAARFALNHMQTFSESPILDVTEVATGEVTEIDTEDFDADEGEQAPAGLGW